MPSGSWCTTYGRLYQRLVQRDQRVAEPGDAGFVAQRLLERLAERDGGVLDGVVRVDLDVALGPHGEVEAAVLAQLGQHVVEEGHAGADLDHPDAVQVELHHDLRLAGEPLHPCHPVHCSSTSSRADLNAAISAGVPTVTRSQRGGPTSRTSTPRSSSPCQTARRESHSPNSTQLASESATDRPRCRSQATSPSRSVRSFATVARGSAASASAARATAWVTADR